MIIFLIQKSAQCFSMNQFVWSLLFLFVCFPPRQGHFEDKIFQGRDVLGNLRYSQLAGLSRCQLTALWNPLPTHPKSPGKTSLPSAPFIREQSNRVSEGHRANLFFTTRFCSFFSLTCRPSKTKRNETLNFIFHLFLMVFLLDPNEHLYYRASTWSTCSAELRLQERCTGTPGGAALAAIQTLLLEGLQAGTRGGGCL